MPVDNYFFVECLMAKFKAYQGCMLLASIGLAMEMAQLFAKDKCLDESTWRPDFIT